MVATSAELATAASRWRSPCRRLPGSAVLCYTIVTTAYTLYLKRLLYFDVMTLAALNALRIVAGAGAAAIPVSPWLGGSLLMFVALAESGSQRTLRPSIPVVADLSAADVLAGTHAAARQPGSDRRRPGRVRADCRLERLREGAELHALTSVSDTLIARGAGRSYGDAALNPELTLSMLALNQSAGLEPPLRPARLRAVTVRAAARGGQPRASPPSWTGPPPPGRARSWPVRKQLGAAGEGLLSFPMEGYTRAAGAYAGCGA